ncbi:hypothetical protein ACIRQY_33505 [Streptomyces sp. NPDC101490]|uniref:hypothetical protein n=1 Tax=Streptomyces sp. NPDC101490 TaxID=3366143 RepID=UPI0038168417
MTAEGLDRGAEKVVGTLIHEAVHALNTARGTKDCSVGQYHNKEFRSGAKELGLVAQADPNANRAKKYGFAFTHMTEETKAAYADEIAAVDKAIRATRIAPWALRLGGTGSGGSTSGGSTEETTGAEADDEQTPPPVKEKEDRNYVKAVCECTPPTVIRASPRALERRNIMCGGCMKKFALE